MPRKNTLNNMMLENIRNTQSYQAIMTDLAIEKVVPLETAERLLGYEIPEYLHSPGGSHVERPCDECMKSGKDAAEPKSRKKQE